MRILMVVMTIAFLTGTAHAQGMGGKGKKHEPSAQKTEDQDKKKVDEKAYQDALRGIAVSHEKRDPWKGMR